MCIITDPNQLVTGDRGPASKYEISIDEGDFKGEIEISWNAEPSKVRPYCLYMASLFGY